MPGAASGGDRRGPPPLQAPGSLALAQRDWKGAVSWYIRAFHHDPSDIQVLYRLCRSLTVAGRTGELQEYDTQASCL